MEVVSSFEMLLTDASQCGVIPEDSDLLRECCEHLIHSVHMARVLAQGLMGWYMVQSGLEDRFHGESDVPRVSQYRLATHLSLAFILYTLLLWSALDHLLPAQKLAEAATASVRKFRWLTHTCKGMVFLTALSGKYLIVVSGDCIVLS
jgi:heme A synthase